MEFDFKLVAPPAFGQGSQRGATAEFSLPLPRTGLGLAILFAAFLLFWLAAPWKRVTAKFGVSFMPSPVCAPDPLVGLSASKTQELINDLRKDDRVRVQSGHVVRVLHSLKATFHAAKDDRLALVLCGDENLVEPCIRGEPMSRFEKPVD